MLMRIELRSWLQACVLSLIGASIWLALAPATAFAAERTLLKFQPPEGSYPAPDLVLGADGNLYGTTNVGGTEDRGSVFKLTPNGVLTAIYSFKGGADSQGPLNGLMRGSDGNFYGTTSGSVNATTVPGTIFRITPAGVLTTLHTFAAGDGMTYISGTLVQDGNGNLFGTMPYYGGAGNNVNGGAVFKLSATGMFSILHQFTTAEGQVPKNGLAIDSSGNLYGTTAFGAPADGSAGGTYDGTIFKMTPQGNVTVLHSLYSEGNGATRLLIANNGVIYGATPSSIFALNGGSYVTLRNLSYSNDGYQPRAGMVIGADGNLYGTLSQGGAVSGEPSYGTVFRMTPAGTFSVLHTFNGRDGSGPGGLTLGPDGNFYGSAGNLGNYNGGGFGTLFKISSGGVFTSLRDFQQVNGGLPPGPLVADAAGNFYGVTSSGGEHTYGTAFKLTSAGVLTTLVSFDGVQTGAPSDGLILAADGNLYGVTPAGGINGQGTVFKLTPSGALSVLYSFTGGANGASPSAGLLQGADGAFYGTTYGGGSAGYGTLFKVSSSGVLTTIHSFTNADGAYLMSRLVQAVDGTLFGTASGGGNGCGTVFKITTAGLFTRLAAFTGIDGGLLGSVCPDGGNPTGLTIGLDGSLYGANSTSVFKITTTGVLTTLHQFAGDDGLYSSTPLVLGSDGLFYGTTQSGGAAQGTSPGAGTVFSISAAGELMTLHTFHTDDGAVPAGLIQGPDGNFSGATIYGGVGSYGGYGVLFTLDGPPMIPRQLTATAGSDGTVTLNWVAAAGADTYTVYMGTTPGGESATPVRIGITGNGTTISGLTPGTAYYFKVAGVNDVGTSRFSNEASTAPATPGTGDGSGGGGGGGGGGAIDPVLLMTLLFAAVLFRLRELYMRGSRFVG